MLIFLCRKGVTKRWITTKYRRHLQNLRKRRSFLHNMNIALQSRQKKLTRGNSSKIWKVWKEKKVLEILTNSFSVRKDCGKCIPSFHTNLLRESDTVRFAMVTIGISLIIRGLLPFFLQCGLALADQGCCTHYYSFIKLFSGLLFSSLFNLKSLWDVLFYHIKILRCLCAFQLLNLSLIWTIFPS